nr:sigma-70 family RNA polymerase sigma factor [Aeromicrobium marinum]
MRTEQRRVLATLVRTTGDLGLAEDAVQDAVLSALQRWPVDGVPDEPRAWLTTVARRKAIDRIRREARRTGKEGDRMELFDPQPDPPASVVRDDQLRLVFTCCHPALALDTQVTLALTTLCGLTAADAARLLLVTESAMARRLTRAKQKIAVAGIPYRIPDVAELPDRLDGVATTVHLLFTSGVASGDAQREERLCDEAVRLARLLLELMPDESRLQGLLALLLLTGARRATRLDVTGDQVPLADQDRSAWDHRAIAEGVGLVEQALRRSRHRAGRFELQAAIAACHASAPRFEDTDWTDVVALYDALLVLEPTDVVRLNRAVAIGERDGPQAALTEIDELAGLHGFHLWHSCRAELLDRLGRTEESRAAFEAALACSPPPAAERRIRRRRDEVGRTVEG